MTKSRRNHSAAFKARVAIRNHVRVETQDRI
jgi:hypothetical protein